MVKDDQGRQGQPISPRGTAVGCPSRARHLTMKLIALVLFAAGSTTATSLLMARWLHPADGAAPEAKTSPAPPAAAPRLFATWPNETPVLALILSAQEHGYLQPCGCSRPQLGGLSRRYQFIETLKKRGWPVVAVDLGDLFDVPQNRGPQALLKYRTSMDALQKMDYAAVGVGLYETEMPLLTTLAEYAINKPTPRILAANIQNKKETFVDAIGSWTLAGGQNGMPKVAIVGTIGPSVAQHLKDPDIRLDANNVVLPKALAEMQAQKPDLRVLLYQGTVEEAKACAAKVPQFDVILCLTKEEEPSDKPERIGDTWVIGVGHKGRYVGVVGFFRSNNPKQPFSPRYQLAALGEEFETPKGLEHTNPVLALMEAYAKEVKFGNYLAKYPQRPHPLQVDFPNATYVGTDACLKCHQEAYKVWFNSDHAKAFASLVNAERPMLRQFDGECVACHVIGFGYKSGYEDETKTADLKNVGCESCHGPGSAHIADTKNLKIRELMNAFKPKPDATAAEETRRINALDQACQKCHDQDNDVHWDFKKKWPGIVHHEKRDKSKK